MWFTALLICLPIGGFILFKSFRATEGNRRNHFLLGFTILTFPFGLLLFQQRTLSAIETNVAGLFASANDSLKFNVDGTCQFYGTDSNSIGNWYVTEYDNPVVILENEQKQEITFDINFDNGELVLIQDKHSNPRTWTKK